MLYEFHLNFLKRPGPRILERARDPGPKFCCKVRPGRHLHHCCQALETRLCQPQPGPPEPGHQLPTQKQPPLAARPFPHPRVSLCHRGLVSAGGGDQVLPEESSPAFSSGGQVENGEIVHISPQLNSTGVTRELGGKANSQLPPMDGMVRARPGLRAFFFFPPTKSPAT